MANRENPGEPKVAIGGLGIDACVVIATGTMSVEDVDRARDSGRLTMKAPEASVKGWASGAAFLEVGGVVVAEGRFRNRRGKSAFVVTRTYQNSSGVRS